MGPVLILPEMLSVTTLMSVREKFPAQKTLLAEITLVHGAALVILVMKMTLIAKSAFLLLTVDLILIPVMGISKSAKNWTVLIFSNAFVSKVTSMTLMVTVYADDCKNGNVKCDTKNSHCETNDAGWASCVCDQGFLEETLTAADNSTYKVCNDIDECKDELDNCHDNAKCTNTPGSFECECEGEYSGDGETCIICPSLECWTFDAGTNTCTPKDECSTLECGAEGLKIGFVNGLFGIDNNGANFLGDQPTLVNETSGEWELTSAFGTNGMAFELDNSTNTVTFYLVVSLAGDDRARSDFEQTNSLINLGDRSIMTTPFGVGMLFSCQYSTVIELSSVSYTVEDVSISDSQSGRGDWSSTFSLT